jgi:23S rRNA-/tRNA-specific pseudouridylate synthase
VHRLDRETSGVTVFGKDAESVGDLLKQADLAMYQAKRRGRYIIEMMTHTYGVSAREALACISQWQQRGYMATEGGKTMNRASGLRVVKYLESGR